MATLVSVAFFHATPGEPAIRLRADEQQALTLPEWLDGSAQAPVAYPRDAAEDPRIDVTLRSDEQLRCVCAVAPGEDPEVLYPGGCGDTRAAAARAAAATPLGRIAPTPLTSTTARLYEASSTVPASRLGQLDVGQHRLAWDWYVRRAGAGWLSAGHSGHDLYVLLSNPAAPWATATASWDNPWVRAIDQVVRLAGSTSGAGDLAEKLHNGLRGIEAYDFHYRPAGAFFGSWTDRFSDQYVELSRFLDRLDQGAGIEQALACYDTATIFLALYAVMGGESRRRHWYDNFRTRRVRRLGDTTFQHFSGQDLGQHQFCDLEAGSSDSIHDFAFDVDYTVRDPQRPHAVAALTQREYDRGLLAAEWDPILDQSHRPDEDGGLPVPPLLARSSPSPDLTSGLRDRLAASGSSSSAGPNRVLAVLHALQELGLQPVLSHLREVPPGVVVLLARANPGGDPVQMEASFYASPIELEEAAKALRQLYDALGTVLAGTVERGAATFHAPDAYTDYWRADDDTLIVVRPMGRSMSIDVQLGDALD